ncbi:MAG TPA: hypothetical protein VF817_01740 [Patescibacteria group bacterium]
MKKAFAILTCVVLLLSFGCSKKEDAPKETYLEGIVVDYCEEGPNIDRYGQENGRHNGYIKLVQGNEVVIKYDLENVSHFRSELEKAKKAKIHIFTRAGHYQGYIQIYKIVFM